LTDMHSCQFDILCTSTALTDVNIYKQNKDVPKITLQNNGALHQNTIHEYPLGTKHQPVSTTNMHQSWEKHNKQCSWVAQCTIL